VALLDGRVHGETRFPHSIGQVFFYFYFFLVFAAYLFALLGVLLPVLAGEEPRIME
jgi:hypothetical protein